MWKFINLTPHKVVLNTGQTFPPSGKVARVKANYTQIGAFSDCGCDVCTNGGGIGCASRPPEFYRQEYGEIEGLPESDGTIFIVSGIVRAAAREKGRYDVVAPATGHPGTIRNESGHIVSVPGFV